MEWRSFSWLLLLNLILNLHELSFYIFQFHLQIFQSCIVFHNRLTLVSLNFSLALMLSKPHPSVYKLYKVIVFYLFHAYLLLTTTKFIYYLSILLYRDLWSMKYFWSGSKIISLSWQIFKWYVIFQI